MSPPNSKIQDFILFFILSFIFLREISYTATLVNLRWNKGDVMWYVTGFTSIRYVMFYMC